MSIKEDLQSALNELTPETWIRSSYFRVEGQRMCFCAHGALQKQVNPAVKDVLAKASLGLTTPISECVAEAIAARSGAAAPAVAAASAATAASSAAAAASIAAPAAPTIATAIATAIARSSAVLADALTLLRRFWDQRPDWVSKTNPDYGSFDAHYLLGMVGLTANFNDDPKTTLEMIREKFRQAIVLAEDLGI